MGKFHFYFVFVILLFISLIPLTGFSIPVGQSKIEQKVGKRLNRLVPVLSDWRHVGKMRIDSFSVHSDSQHIEIFFSSPLSYVPIREAEVNRIETEVKSVLGRRFQSYNISLISDHHPLVDLIPNLFRSDNPLDTSRLLKSDVSGIPIVRPVEKEMPVNGLFNNHIALWASHGWYYESKLDRWEWQRARLFGTVEDMSPMNFVLPYLVPMLENSGARVFLPRERDWQTEEVIVDNDHSSNGSELIIPQGVAVDRLSYGYLLKDTLVSGDHPFTDGTSFKVRSSSSDQMIKYIPSFDSKGRYSVSVSYPMIDASLSEVIYTIYHTGGKSEFLVNQKMGGGTWIYLGTFDFNRGKDPDHGMVTVSCKNNTNGYIGLDAIKFGGGMGTVARRPADELLPNKKSLSSEKKSEITAATVSKINNQAFKYKLSGKGRYLEAARYYLQSAGIPDTIVYNLNHDKNDYNDDYQSRGEWVNYLMGNPNGPVNHRAERGLKIPIDLAFAFHTDAGVTGNDSIIGTLAIYSTLADQGKFPNGKSRMASRDLADLIQTQIVNDIRECYNPQWTRRGLWDKAYSEAWRPNVPTMLLELFSHQNLADVKFGLDPRFRFDVSRAIYKGMLRFQSFQENRPFVVHPLPVNHMAIERVDGDSLKLSWSPVSDPLEPSAKATKFRVYQRIDDNGFDNGVLVKDTVIILPPGEYNHIYSYRVTAINDGGESFPSEILSAGLKQGSKGNVLIVNGFDRICGPSIIDTEDVAGVAFWKDKGVPDHMDIGYIGEQYDFNKSSDWVDDDSPGWGASYGNMEGKVIPGNCFNYPYLHGRAIMTAGYSFVSMSDEVFCQPKTGISHYFATDLILGEERSTPGLKDSMHIDFKIYTPEMMSKITELINGNNRLFLSGAYIGSEFGECNDSITAAWVKKNLHFSWRTGHASKGGQFYSTDYASQWLNGKWHFNVEYDSEIYSVEAPDGIEPDGEGALSAFRYGENNVSAGVAYKGNYRVVALGIPFETIAGDVNRNLLMNQILNFFESK